MSLTLKAKSQKNKTLQDKQSVKSTIIGSGTKISGTITTRDQVIIQGDMEGKIISQNTVHIDKSGKVQADIFALNIIIEGHVIGNMNAKERFELLASGSVVGEVKAAKISIQDSASVKGKIEVGSIKEIPKLADPNKD